MIAGRWRAWIVCAFAAAALLAPVASRAATEKVALVIGNSDYKAVSRLPNPINDATAVADSLKAIGFDVTLATNLNDRGLRGALRSFETKVEGASIALVYYAGHGMEVDGVNYLVPIDAELARDTHIADEAVPLDRVLDAVARASKVRIVLLDACRDNPFAAKMQRTSSTRSIGRGLARVEPAAATIISYAAAANTVAADGAGQHSPYAQSLMKHIATPGLEVNFVFRRISAEVWDLTKGRQQPAVYYPMLGAEEIYLAGPPPAATAAARDPAKDFDVARSLNTIEGWDTFLRYHDSGYFADLARAARGKVQEAKLSPVTVPAQTATDESARASGSDADIPLEEAYWRTIRGSTLVSDFKAYIRRYPNGAFLDLAQARIQALGRAADVNTLGGPTGTADPAALRRNAMVQIERIPKTMVQFGLTALGFPVKATGVIDALTRRAVREYQASVGDAQTGDLTPQQTVDLLLAAAAVGDAHAQTAVGFMVASGVGLSTDYGAARLWFTKAAQQNQPYALMNLAVIYRDGLGVERDPGQARQLFAKAAQGGLKDAERSMRTLDIK